MGLEIEAQEAHSKKKLNAERKRGPVERKRARNPPTAEENKHFRFCCVVRCVVAPITTQAFYANAPRLRRRVPSTMLLSLALGSAGPHPNLI